MAGTIQKTIMLFQDAFEQLNLIIPEEKQEKLAIMVNEAMSSQARSFHTSDHIFDLADPDNPIITLAALFHDIVYYHIDNGFTPSIRNYLKNYLSIEGNKVTISYTDNKHDLLFELTLDVFGFKNNSVLSPFNGMNEFLSALLMNCALREYVDIIPLLKAAVCIEATIPFRKPAEDGITPSQALAERLNAVNTSYSFNFNKSQIDDMIYCAVIFSNKDVMNFAETEVARFLDNTWKLLPETNPSLRTSGIFTINNYLTALKKMEQFMCMLNADNIFAQYKKTPDKKQYKELRNRAKKNLYAGCEYLGIKLLATAVMYAAADISGGDAPISLFMGDVSKKDENDITFEDMLPEAYTEGEITSTIHSLLAIGRASDSDFDLKNSPLANYIYSSLGAESCTERLADAKAMLNKEMSTVEFLNRFPGNIIRPLLGAFAEMAFTRKVKIENYLKSRKQNQ